MPAKIGMRKDYTGNRFGRLTAIEYSGKIGHAAKWKFRCDCGNEIVRRVDKVMNQENASCGCYYEEYLKILHERKIKRDEEKEIQKNVLRQEKKLRTKLYRDICGEKHGHLYVYEKITDGNGPDVEYKCLCECGNEVIKTQKYLVDNQNMLSCGCTRKYKRPEYVRSHERIADIYRGMIERCYNPACAAYENYGARGIKICDWWLDKYDGLERFIKWSLKHGYQEDLSIDRINVDGNYTPKNCRWADDDVQANNKTNTVRIWYDGEEMSLAQFAKRNGLQYNAIRKYTRHFMFSGDYLMTMLKNSKNA